MSKFVINEKSVVCDHCGQEVLKEHATECVMPTEPLHSWYYCLACDLSFTMAAARNAGVNTAISREQVKFMCETIRENIKIKE
jgi:hypothetical protein